VDHALPLANKQLRRTHDGRRSGDQTMKPAPFNYHKIGSVQEAVALLGEHGDEAKVLAGGLSLVPMMNFRLARPSVLVDIGELAELQTLRCRPGELEIGALVRHADLEGPLPMVGLEASRFVSQVASLIGHYPIRLRGTFGGSIAHADPAAEWCVFALLYDAVITVEGPAGRREVSAQEFFLGFMTTDLADDEVVVSVRVPLPAGRAVMRELARRNGDFALVLCAVHVEVRAGVCTDARLSLGGVEGRPVRLHEVELAMLDGEVGRDWVDDAAGHAADLVDPGSDIHASAGDRRAMVRTLVRRALEDITGLVAA
jgi:carbon-monoxide dehydrogenase medium subunit